MNRGIYVPSGMNAWDRLHFGRNGHIFGSFIQLRDLVDILSVEKILRLAEDFQEDVEYVELLQNSFTVESNAINYKKVLGCIKKPSHQLLSHISVIEIAFHLSKMELQISVLNHSLITNLFLI